MFVVIFIIFSAMLKFKAYNSRTKEFDSRGFHQAIDYLKDLLGADNLMVSFSTFDEATLYMKLKEMVLMRDNKIYKLESSLVNRQTKYLSKAGIQVKKIDYVSGDILLDVDGTGVKMTEYLDGNIYRAMP